jgi:hypothetical protein
MVPVPDTKENIMTKTLKKKSPAATQKAANTKPVKKVVVAATKAAAPRPKPDTAPAAKSHTKQAILIGLLRGAKGATVEEMIEATGWQSHSVQGVMSGVLKKKLGLAIISEKEQRGRVYRIGGAGK